MTKEERFVQWLKIFLALFFLLMTTRAVEMIADVRNDLSDIKNNACQLAQ